MKKILIDTDIGDDIDDALALAYALKSKSLDLRGITTTFRNTKIRQQLVLQQLKEYGRLDIPVAEGIGKPLLEETDVNAFPAHWQPDREQVSSNCDIHAVDLIIETLKQNPDTIIAAIAPLTNIACAVRKAPEVMEQAEIWMMGGMYSEPYPEWNIQCDPEAAAIVLSSCRNVRMVGLDVTLKCRMTEEQLEQSGKLTDKESALLYDWTQEWMSKSGHLPILHDPLVLAALENPELLKFEKKHIQVECAGTCCRGVTAERTDPFMRSPQQNNVEMAIEVDTERFMNQFLRTVFPHQY